MALSYRRLIACVGLSSLLPMVAAAQESANLTGHVTGEGGIALTGAADTVSTVLRQTIRQLVTPNYLRGRMTSINMMFFMGGPQLGELEAGSLAAIIGAPLSVVIGGVGSLICAAIAAVKSKSLMEFEM